MQDKNTSTCAGTLAENGRGLIHEKGHICGTLQYTYMFWKTPHCVRLILQNVVMEHVDVPLYKIFSCPMITK